MTGPDRSEYGLKADKVRLLNNSKIREIADHIISNDVIWRRMARVKDDKWIEQDLGREINAAMDKYARRERFAIGALNSFEVVALLRSKAKEVREEAVSSRSAPGPTRPSCR